MDLAELYDHTEKSIDPNGSTLNSGIYAIVKDYKDLGTVSVEMFHQQKDLAKAIDLVKNQDQVLKWADLRPKQWRFLLVREYVEPKEPKKPKGPRKPKKGNKIKE